MSLVLFAGSHDSFRPNQLRKEYNAHAMYGIKVSQK